MYGVYMHTILIILYTVMYGVYIHTYFNYNIYSYVWCNNVTFILIQIYTVLNEVILYQFFI